jgi:hypothetical protein
LKVNKLTAPIYTGYPIPKFEDYKDFWSSGVAATVTGKGLADYSNHGFFTVGNNINNKNYALPSPLVASYQKKDFKLIAYNDEMYTWTYLVGPVQDYKTNTTETEVKRVKESFLYQYLPPELIQNQTLAYTLDRYVLEDMQRLLLPRAVAYSAGLINHFFRGKMQIDAPASGIYSMVDQSTIGSLTNTKIREGFKGFAKIKLKLSNITPDNEAMPAGKLVGVLKFKRN